ncbi:MAG: 3-phosphoshikimate 1-carboxyvinyltransferase [Granulosicoccaceae bacterium]
MSSLTYTVQAGGTLTGVAKVPGDKSMSHRSVMFGSLANGTTEVDGFLQGEDALHTLDAFVQMGVNIERTSGNRLVIEGKGHKALKVPSDDIYLGNSGTGMRLLAGLMAGLGMPCRITGDESLALRPMGRVIKPLQRMGAQISGDASDRPPLTLKKRTAPLNAIEYDCPVVSAQVKSCVLLAGLFADGRTVVNETGITRDHTERMLNGFGVDVQVDGLSASIEGGQSLQATSLTVPGDISSAAFFLVGASISVGSDVTLQGVGMNPTRTGIIDILKLMDAKIDIINERVSGGEPVADLHVVGTELIGVEIPERLVSLAIDEFPSIFVAASVAKGTTVITGAEELRVKETDRIQVMVDGLQALGVDITGTPDGAIINGGSILGGTADSCGDHRTAMAFSMAALMAKSPITVLDCANVATSFPGFVELAGQMGLNISSHAGKLN